MSSASATKMRATRAGISTCVLAIQSPAPMRMAAAWQIIMPRTSGRRNMISPQYVAVKSRAAR